MNKQIENNRFKESPAIVFLSKYFLLITLAALIIIFSLTIPNYLSQKNVFTILKTTGFVALLSFGVMIIMRIGEMTFSIGAQATLAATIAGKILSVQLIENYYISALVGIALSTLLIMLCAYFIIEWNIPSFISTLSASIVMDALVIWLSDNKQMYDKNWPEEFLIFKTASVFNIPLMIIVAFAILIIFWVINSKTRFGRYVFCVGANPIAAAQAGINVRKIKYLAFLISGFVAGAAGILQASNQGQIAHAMGGDYLMTAICSATLSAAFLKPGDYNVPGVIVSSLTLVLIRNAVSNMGAKSYINDIITAAILLIGVGIIAVVRKESLVKVSFN